MIAMKGLPYSNPEHVNLTFGGGLAFRLIKVRFVCH